MSFLKVSGKRFTLPDSARGRGWEFESRPGGWVLATSPKGERLRFAASELRGKLGFVFASGDHASGYGELIAVSRGDSASSSAASIAADLTAQFPGKVRKILVADGAHVESGESLVLVEAMKMEFAIKAPLAGKVARLRVKEGQQLQPGDQFLDFEPDA